DLTYVLSLGLALNDAGDVAALPLLERAGERGKGGPEVVRRLMLAHMLGGDRAKGRGWLQKLMQMAPQSEACILWQARDCAILAIEAFNRKAFAEAVRQWER